MMPNGKEVSEWPRGKERAEGRELAPAATEAADRPQSALRPEDLVWAQLATFRRKVERSLEAIRKAAAIGPVGVAFSGGKDSTVTLDLVRQVVPGAPAGFFDSGCELESTMDLVRRSGAEIVTPRLSMLEMARYAGWWEYEKPVDAGCPFDAKHIVIQEPSETFVVRRGLRCIATGLRAEESGARARNASSRGELYQGADRTWYCAPLAFWRIADVWAHIASRKLDYNSAYDRMSEAGVPRESQRVATLLGDRGSGMGRHAWLRMSEPSRWREIVREFPGIARLS